MAVYAALVSVARSLHQILNLDRYNIDPFRREKIVSLHDKVRSILIFLEGYYSDKYYRGDEIRRAANEAQDFMEDACLCSMPFDHEILDMAVEKVAFIWEELMKMNDVLRSRTHSSSSSSEYHSSSTVQVTAKEMVVGFDEDLNKIKERLLEDSAKLQIVPIVGMGGIGKTTLARRAYEDSLLARDHFDVCAWITISAEHHRKEILSALLRSFKKQGNGDDDEQSDESDAQLVKLSYQHLVGRRYLIVIDDIWTTKAWDDLKAVFPDNGNRSRILLTTRLSEVAVHAAGSSCTPLHRLNVLNEDQSWKLLQKRIFGKESCPPPLVDIGKKMARNCRGLPLTIVVVAGLLQFYGNKTKEEWWENISESISSKESTIGMQCSKILCLSYDRLPLRLKPCFLYIAAFPEDSEIDVSKLIQLWVAEGFLKPYHDQLKCSLEDVGERCLEDLVNRSLLSASEKGVDGKLKTVGIHDMLREICITKAEEDGFLHQFSSKTNSGTESMDNPYRRLKIHSTGNFQEWEILYSSVRSILLFSDGYDVRSIYIRSRHILVLDAPNVTWSKFELFVSTSAHLKYLAFTLDLSRSHGFPFSSISKHLNLETLVVRVTHSLGRERERERDRGPLQVPYEILKMPRLRHLIWDTSFHLSNPLDDKGIVHESDLQTMETVRNFRFDQEIIEILVNLKKLQVEYHITKNHDNWDDFHFDNLVRLRNLEDLQMSMLYYLDPSIIWNHAFPRGLKKLYLRCVPFPWENMAMIGSLPNLQVLEMIDMRVAKVSEWTTAEDQFLQLKYFRCTLDFLAKWEMEKEHFPCLESLILVGAKWINEIPSGIGEIDTLQYMELMYCKKSLVDSARRIAEEQHENGNSAFQLRVIVEIL